MKQPLNNVLSRIFVRGFYQAHAGLFLFFFLVMIGSVDPGELFMYHKILMLAFISSPLMLLVVFVAWFLYNLKCLHYVIGQISAPPQHFMFYSMGSFNRKIQLKSWFLVQLILLLPIIVYGLVAVGVGLKYHYYLTPAIIVIYLLLLAAVSARLYVLLLDRLVDSGNPSWLLQWIGNWRKPYFSLFIYHVLNRLKVAYAITKGLTWLIVISIFSLFNDVKTDARVAGMAVLAIAVAHAVLVFEGQRFEQAYLSFARNFPYTHIKRYCYFVCTYLMLLLPEGLWLLNRFNFVLAIQLLLMALSMLLLFHTLIYYIGLSMSKYLQCVMGLFMLLFWVMMYKLMPVVITGNILVSYLLVIRYYYRDMPVVAEK
ncbi:hypothetical protein MUGA111182_01210 [Mucilaginibacter galii]|uniref:Uncharacterized protein n=1 Tax=Mucilaginibacter galii TaxID=2005073 RepID=A0A917J6E9_9SPHI|nr:hypothetical protein [Mucilaginibacter galii]GGI48927.1 hypothetical protein GCM10011425_01390 [Mucilaginibacter galii]